MTRLGVTRRGALHLALGALAGAVGAPSEMTRVQAQVFQRVGIAFGATVSITLEAADKQMAEAAFAAGFAEIRAIDRLASLTRPDSEVFRLNRDGFLDRPDPALVEMLHMAEAMRIATAGAFDVTIQPLWLAFDSAARRGTWPSEAEIRVLRERIDQGLLRVAPARIAFAKPGMMITLNSLARGLAADRVAAALVRTGIVNAFFDTDVLGAIGRRPDRAHWRALVRNPRLPEESLGVADVTGCLATSGDYQYFWSADYSRNHIIDPRRGVSPSHFSSVSVLAKTGLAADALSTAAFLLDPDQAARILKSHGAEALLLDKAGSVTRTAGFPAVGPG